MVNETYTRGGTQRKHGRTEGAASGGQTWRSRRRPGPGGGVFGLAVVAALALAANAVADEEIDVLPGLSRAEVQTVLDAAAPGSKIVFHGSYDFSAEPGWLLVTKPLRILSSEKDPAVFHGKLGADGRPAGFETLPNGDPDYDSAFRLFKFDGAGEVRVQGIQTMGFRTALYVTGDTQKVRVTETSITNGLYGIYVAPTGLQKLRVSDNELLDVENGIWAVGDGSSEPEVKIEGNRVEYLREELFTSRAPSHVPEGIFVADFPGARVRGNWVRGFDQMAPAFPGFFLPAIGIEVLYTLGGTVEGPRVDDNDVENCAIGVVLIAHAARNPLTATITGGRLSENRIVDGGYGVVLTSGANGYRIDDTEFSGNTNSDVYLAGGVNAEQSFFFPPWNLYWTFAPWGADSGILFPPGAQTSHDNKATVRPGDVVTDHGNNNRVDTDEDAEDAGMADDRDDD